MTDSNLFRKLINHAIEQEKESQQHYAEMRDESDDPFVREILEAIYQEEVNHEKKLRGLLDTIGLKG